jgi:hypothetical protein
LADNNTITELKVGKTPIDICSWGDKIFVLNQKSASISILTSKLNIENPPLSLSVSLTSSYPNPFNPECYIPLNAKCKVQNVKCKIYNILGQLVREIECSTGQEFKGSRVYWDGRDTRGLEVPSGVYFYKVAGESVRKMVVLR